MNERVLLKRDQVKICVVGVGALGSMVRVPLFSEG